MSISNIVKRIKGISLDIFWIAIEHIINMILWIVVLITIILLVHCFFKKTSLFDTILTGIISGIIASIIVQSNIDLRDSKRDVFKLQSLWEDFYYSDFSAPKYCDEKLNIDVVNHINNKHSLVADINNMLNNKYGFRTFKCNIDKTVISFVNKLEIQLGPYRDKDNGALYAYRVFLCLVCSTYYSNNEEYPCISAIGNIIRACISTHTPFFREKCIFKKSGIKDKYDFYRLIRFIEYMNDNLLHNAHLSAAVPFNKTLANLKNDIDKNFSFYYYI